MPVSQDRRTIRVLDLHEKPADADEYFAPLSGTLRTVSLSTCPSFDALSYAWGKFHDPPYTISCNGCQINITRNCCYALRRLRKRYGTIAIWVDAICINQKDEEEKNSQIPLIGEIFAWSQHAYIWLGNGSPTSYTAIEYFRAIASNANTIGLAGVSCFSAVDPKERARALRKYKFQTALVYNKYLVQRK